MKGRGEGNKRGERSLEGERKRRGDGGEVPKQGEERGEIKGE